MKITPIFVGMGFIFTIMLIPSAYAEEECEEMDKAELFQKLKDANTKASKAIGDFDTAFGKDDVAGMGNAVNEMIQANKDQNDAHISLLRCFNDEMTHEEAMERFDLAKEFSALKKSINEKINQWADYVIDLMDNLKNLIWLYNVTVILFIIFIIILFVWIFWKGLGPFIPK